MAEAFVQFLPDSNAILSSFYHFMLQIQTLALITL